jgi:hypothetical protein
LGVYSFPNYFLATAADGNEIEIPIDDQHYFTAALTLAYSTFEHGWAKAIPRRTYEIVAGRSAEMNTADKIYAEGGSVEGATVDPLQLLRISAEDLLGS